MTALERDAAGAADDRSAVGAERPPRLLGQAARASARR